MIVSSERRCRVQGDVKKLKKCSNGAASSWKTGSCPEKVFGERDVMAAW